MWIVSRAHRYGRLAWSFLQPSIYTYLSGDVGEDALYLRSQATCAEQDVELCTGARVMAIDRRAHTTMLDNGDC